MLIYELSNISQEGEVYWEEKGKVSAGLWPVSLHTDESSRNHGIKSTRS